MPSLTATIEQGRIEPDGPEGVLTVSRLNGRRVTVDIEIYRNSLSDKQRRYYWGYLIAMIAGYCTDTDKDYYHGAMLEKFAPVKEGPLGPVLKRTSRGQLSMTTIEAEDYFANIRMWSAEYFRDAPHRGFLALPNEYDINEARKA